MKAGNGYLEGYEEARLHVRTLFPGLELEPCKAYMRVKDGRLVDPMEEARAGTSRGTLGAEANRFEEGANDVEPLAESS